MSVETLAATDRRVVPKKRRLIMSELIISNPKIMMGKPVIKGTRITVELILGKIAAGESVDQILNEHPRLTHEAIQASCAFAADTNSPRA